MSTYLTYNYTTNNPYILYFSSKKQQQSDPMTTLHISYFIILYCFNSAILLFPTFNDSTAELSFVFCVSCR